MRIALLAALLAACSAGVRQAAPQCTSDEQCDPRDFCILGECKGSSAGDPDASVPDASSPDASVPDASVPDAGEPDAGTPDAGPVGVGYDGGTVDLLDFVLTGDTRPPQCDDILHYPSATIAAEVTQMAAVHPQFALDLGDHMNSCVTITASARTQMQKYADAVSKFPGPWFMTMGNHECGTSLDCSFDTGDNNFETYMSFLATISKKTTPNYFIDVQTRLGLARLVFIADSFTTQAWGEATLAEADRIAKYTIVVKHHPMTGSRTGPAWSHTLVGNHKYSLILTAHDHQYSHDVELYGGRSVICGLGGADTTNTGFCRVQQQPDATLRFTRYDLTGNPTDSWSVGPQ